MKVLVLTLGHNASAIVVEDGIILAGYEEERLSGIKADSTFPSMAIKRLKEMYNLAPNISICISHWFLDGDFPLNDPKPDFESMVKVIKGEKEPGKVHFVEEFADPEIINYITKMLLLQYNTFKHQKHNKYRL